jgi:hypothetical protein
VHGLPRDAPERLICHAAPSLFLAEEEAVEQGSLSADYVLGHGSPCTSTKKFGSGFEKMMILNEGSLDKFEC